MKYLLLTFFLSCFVLACGDDSAQLTPTPTQVLDAGTDSRAEDLGTEDLGTQDLGGDTDVPDISVVNEPKFTTSVPQTATEHEEFTYEPSCEGEGTPLISVSTEDTCKGTFLDGVYRWTPDELDGGTSCVVSLRCADDVDGVTQSADIEITETNETPERHPVPAELIAYWGRSTSAQLSAIDADIPIQALTYTLTDHACDFEPTLSESGLLEYTCPAVISICDAQIEVSDGEAMHSRNIMLRCENTPPMVADVAISPPVVTRPGITLTCDYTFGDAEFDQDESLIEWLVDGAPVAQGRTFSTYKPGDTVSCRVTGNDGFIEVAAITSPNCDSPLHFSMTAGDDHTCWIDEGHLRCWGANDFWVLGVDDVGQSYSPVTPLGMDADVTQVAANRNNTCAIQAGALYCWGYNSDGQLGIGHSGGGQPGVGSYLPRPVLDMDQNVSAVSVGGSSICAIKTGALYCWGDNFDGRLGDGTTSDQDRPAPVIGMDSNVSAVSLGAGHVCAIKDGALFCWGYNFDGQLGIPAAPKFSNSSPLAVPGMEDHVELVAAGIYSTCAIRLGELFCWGQNSVGQLGDGTLLDRDSPTQVVSLTGVSDIDLNDRHTCASHSAGLSCWGLNADGQLGNDSKVNADLPQLIMGLDPLPMTSVVAGKKHTCVAQGDEISCWGQNNRGQLGQPDLTFKSFTPLEVAGLNGVDQLTDGPLALASGVLLQWGWFGPVPIATQGLTNVEAASATCAVVAGALYCWDSVTGPVAVPTLVNNVTSVSKGAYSTCAIRSGALYCWGQNTYGQLGDGTYSTRATPTAVTGMNADVTKVVAGGRMTCAIKAGALYCWGDNQEYQLGVSTVSKSNIPIAVPGMDVGVTDVAVIYNETSINGHACAVKSGALYCWGLDRSGQLGQPTYVNLNTPTLVAGLETGVTTVGTSVSHTCVIQSGAVLCMGANDAGQSGQPFSATIRTPTLVPLMDALVTDIFVNSGITCGLRDGQVSCWGRGIFLGRTVSESLVPQYIGR